MPEIKVKEGLADVEFFGKADIVIDKETGEKHIGSEYPAHYFEPQCADIDEQIRRIEYNLENGLVPDKGKPADIAELRKLKKMKDKIDESRPVLNAGHIDALVKVRKDLGAKIKDAMFSRSDEMKGIADSHEEYRRQSEPCISLSGDELLLAKKMNCRVSNDGKVSRNDASRVWKIISRSIGETSDTEVLRRP